LLNRELRKRSEIYDNRVSYAKRDPPPSVGERVCFQSATRRPLEERRAAL